METVGRVFAAVPMPDETRLALAEHVGELEIPGRNSLPQNWHITLRFLGAIDLVTHERFLSGLDDISVPRFRVRLDHFGAFPRPARATVVWVGVGQGEAELAALNERAEEAAVAAGLAGEERPFHPHVTLARVRPPSDVRHLLDEEIDLGWRCDRLVVFRSHLGEGPARYEPLETIPFPR